MSVTSGGEEGHGDVDCTKIRPIKSGEFKERRKRENLGEGR